MFRPTIFTKLIERFVQFTNRKKVKSVNIPDNYTQMLSQVDNMCVEEHRPDPLVAEVFSGAPDEFVYNLSMCSDNDPRRVYMGWADALSGIPIKLTPMYLLRTEWVLWYANGSVEVIELPRTGGWDITGTYVNYPNQTVTPMPLGVIKAAKVGYGEQNSAVGCRWELYTV